MNTALLPLAGMRVIEISAFVAAPLGGMTLAQLGADVIRIDPLGGASDRGRWPITTSGASLYWNGLNQGKRSICVDLRSAAGQALITDLVGASGPDGGIVLTNAVGRAGLTYERLREARPDLIFMKIQGHHDGTPAVDYTVNANVGFPMVTGPQGHADPVNHVLPAWDIACGLYAALAVTAADRQRRSTGQGQLMSVALQDVALAMAGNLGFLSEAQVNGVTRPRIGNYLYGGFARDFICSDGVRVMAVALTKRHWKDLLRVTGMSDVINGLEQSLGADFTTDDDRFIHREVLAALISKWFEASSYDEVARALDTTSLLWSRYQSFAELIGTDLADNPMMSVIDQPGVGSLLTAGSPIALVDGPPAARPAPLLGADTDSVLADLLDLDPAAIERLHADGVVAGQDARTLSTVGAGTHRTEHRP